MGTDRGASVLAHILVRGQVKLNVPGVAAKGGRGPVDTLAHGPTTTTPWQASPSQQATAVEKAMRLLCN